ncbi:hypothetical protein LTR62_002627 [Meristemomyces frigidus]|uniref:Glycoside hydrolase family 32 protein n=1 Tax=Meristemomyces frigidus TaxID=1508187 RepID=A0AAN7TSU2_9PEZI|nr:hypothetical protein LTR62_002627 [Meristemomyces frigidus]
MKTITSAAALLAALPAGIAQQWGPPAAPAASHGGTTVVQVGDGQIQEASRPSDHPMGPPGGPGMGPPMGPPKGPPGGPPAWSMSGHPPPPPSPTAASSAPASTASSAPGGSNTQSCTPLTYDQIQAGGNNSLFTQWRSHSHFIAPAGWMNDPCGPMYDPVRDIYHLFYQWHPQHINWGNISWGYATSKDLITWTDHNGWQDAEARALGPSGGEGFPEHYNGLGIFSGTAQPVNVHGEVDGTLLLMYTSVSWLPTSWNIAYHSHTESQSLAMSTDGGKTFQQYEGNPVISATTETAPMDWNITGFRDPFLEPWPAMDAVLGMSEPHYYAVFGSGIKGVGPRIPLWTAPSSDLTSWTFLGALWEPTDNSSLGPVLSTGSYGFNFEVSGFFSLPDSKGDLHYFVNMGTEGGNVSFHESAHWALWNEGNISRRDNGSAAFTPLAGGAGDWGLSYALTSFNDTKNNRRVQWAWTPEDLVGDAGLFSAQQQGFQGSLALPRELFVHEVDGVTDPTGSLAAAKEAVLTPTGPGTFNARTLGVRPLPDVVAGITANATYASYPSGKTYTTPTILQKQGSSHMELKVTLTAFSSGAAGVMLAASPDMKEYTTVTYEPSNNTILVDRSHSTTIAGGFNTATVTGYFSPYQLGSLPEEISLDIFLDGSLLEVYVNERFALATRIYPSMDCSTGFGIYVGEGGSVVAGMVEAWMGTLNVWPQRPLNSSSPLLWDTAAETNNYTWWSGN